MDVQKEARKDAKEYARAQMFYGEGAGTRRKLIQATVDGKIARDPAYGRAFRQELSRQDMADHVTKARWERERRDAVQATRKTVRAVVTGNHRGANTTVLVVGVAAYYAHQFGIDKKLYEAGKRKLRKFRTRNRKDENGATIHDITTVR